MTTLRSPVWHLAKENLPRPLILPPYGWVAEGTWGEARRTVYGPTYAIVWPCQEGSGSCDHPAWWTVSISLFSVSHRTQAVGGNAPWIPSEVFSEWLSSKWLVALQESMPLKCRSEHWPAPRAWLGLQYQFWSHSQGRDAEQRKQTVTVTEAPRYLIHVTPRPWK